MMTTTVIAWKFEKKNLLLLLYYQTIFYVKQKQNLFYLITITNTIQSRFLQDTPSPYLTSLPRYVRLKSRIYGEWARAKTSVDKLPRLSRSRARPNSVDSASICSSGGNYKRAALVSALAGLLIYFYVPCNWIWHIYFCI